MQRESSQLAVALHGVEPATFEHCALIRDWLSDLGVDRLTLMVVPAAGDHPFFQRSPALAAWLHERRVAGDGLAQQGFGHPRRFDWWIAPGLWRAGTLLHKGATLRVDVHPEAFGGSAGRTRALERTLRCEAERRRPVTYDELAAVEARAARLACDAPRVLRVP